MSKDIFKSNSTLSKVLCCFVVFALCLVRPNNLSLVCLYLSLYISFLLFINFLLLLTHCNRKHYYVKLIESIQFVCIGNESQSDWLKYI